MYDKRRKFNEKSVEVGRWAWTCQVVRESLFTQEVCVQLWNIYEEDVQGVGKERSEILQLWVLLLLNWSVMSGSLWPQGLQHARSPCPSLSPRVSSNSCPLSWWCHPTIASSVSLLLLVPSAFPSIRIFSKELALHNWWSFSVSNNPSNEYSGLISFRINWFDLLAVQGTPKSLLQHYSLK